MVVLVVGAARHRPERDEAERSPCVPFTFGIGVGRERQVLNLHAHRNHLLANLDLLLPGNHLINVTNSNTPPQKKEMVCVLGSKGAQEPEEAWGLVLEKRKRGGEEKRREAQSRAGGC